MRQWDAEIADAARAARAYNVPPVCTAQWDEAAWANWFEQARQARARVADLILEATRDPEWIQHLELKSKEGA